MPIPKINNKAPVFKGECTGNKTISLSDLKGKNVVLYFYPKDSTPGCTTEGQDFRDLKAQFTKANTVIFGLSRESPNLTKILKRKKNLISILSLTLMKKYAINTM